MDAEMKLADKCKWYEKNFSLDQMIPKLPVIIRLDGNNFRAWTKSLEKPYDKRLSDLMIDLTNYLVKITNAKIGYTQSDEITLILYSDNDRSQIYHNGKKQKILSKLASECSVHFNLNVKKYITGDKESAIFDARIYQVPTIKDAAMQLVWRERDAIRNSILNLGRSVYSHNDLINKKTDKIKSMLFEKGIDWNNYSDSFKRGTYIKRISKLRKYSQEELDKLPPFHDARKNPDLLIERSANEILKIPFIDEIENKESLILDNNIII